MFSSGSREMRGEDDLLEASVCKFASVGYYLRELSHTHTMWLSVEETLDKSFSPTLLSMMVKQTTLK